jgi:TPR repeat protein
MYWQGLGVQKDEESAKFWWKISASQGDPSAVRLLEEGQTYCDEEDWDF